MSTQLSITLGQIENELAIYYLPPIYVLGTIGNLVNAAIFCHPKFRSAGCSWYFLFVSLAHIFLLNTSCLIRIITVASHFDAFAYVLALCKFSGYMDVLSLVLSRNFLCLICIDRWIVTSSNAWIRRQSSPRIALWTIGITTTIWIVFSVHAWVGYSILPGIVCYTPRSYVLFYSLYNIIIAIGPLICMVVFSVLILINVRQIGRRIQPSMNSTVEHQTNNVVRGRKKRDQQFIRLTLFQVMFYVSFNAIRTITPFVTYWRTVVVVSVGDERALIYFAHYIGIYLLYTYAAVGCCLI